MNLRKDHYRILSFIQRDFEKFSGSKLWVGGLSAADLTSFSARPRPIFGLPHHAQRSAFRWVRLCLLKVLRPSKSFVFFALPPREELLKKILSFEKLRPILVNCFDKKKSYYTVDHLARGSMKNAANCASECELQDI